jgi:hypothetical protein
MLNFKIEIFLLLMSIVLFTLSAFCFSYAIGSTAFVNALWSYPYRNYAILFIGFGGGLMTVASVSYSKRSKTRL